MLTAKKWVRKILPEQRRRKIDEAKLALQVDSLNALSDFGCAARKLKADSF